MEYPYETTEQLTQARALFEQAFTAQKQGMFDSAITLYRRSVESRPTAEAYTYMGWTYSFLGDYNRAITCCMKAVEVDPDFGNAYNDIGAYMIELGRFEDALPWLKKAIRAPKYDCAHYPFYNMGKVFEKLGRLIPARDAYARALSLKRGYPLAAQALMRVVAGLN